MRDWRVVLAFTILVAMMGVLIFLSLEKKSEDVKQDIQITTLFKTVEALTKKVSELKNIQGIDGKTPVKGVDYFDGKDGSNGKDGTNGTNGLNGSDGKDGVNGVDGAPARDLLIECQRGELFRKFDGDSFWQRMNIKCETVR